MNYNRDNRETCLHGSDPFYLLGSEVVEAKDARSKPLKAVTYCGSGVQFGFLVKEHFL